MGFWLTFVVVCSFIKTFDGHAPDPDRDSERVQVCCTSQQQFCKHIAQSAVSLCSLKAGCNDCHAAAALVTLIHSAGCFCWQEFLVKMETAFIGHSVWASTPPDHQNQAVEVCVLRSSLCRWMC